MAKPDSTESKFAALRHDWMTDQSAYYDEAMEKCESPIERLFLAGLFMDTLVSLTSWHETIVADSSYGDVHCQLPVTVRGHEYRLDFALMGKDYDIRVAVECDGHDFHERTKEQAKRDKSRDRSLTGAGWIMLRFTGSELWADAEKCAQELISTYMNEWHRRHEIAKTKERS